MTTGEGPDAAAAVVYGDDGKAMVQVSIGEERLDIAAFVPLEHLYEPGAPNASIVLYRGEFGLADQPGCQFYGDIALTFSVTGAAVIGSGRQISGSNGLAEWFDSHGNGWQVPPAVTFGDTRASLKSAPVRTRTL